MGASCARETGRQLERAPPEGPVRRPAPVTLHVYDLGTSGGASVLNRILTPMGTGAFHCGVEVYGWEWSYSDLAGPGSRADTGVFTCPPRCCQGHTYLKSVDMGKTSLTEKAVLILLQLLQKEWVVANYDVWTHNCCHFCDEVCRRLGVGSVPPWVTSLAGVGAKMMSGDAADVSCCREPVMHRLCCPGTVANDGPEDVVEILPALTPATPYRTPARRGAAQ
mmetsp:Transcript_47372/g.133255  ORF Transcript_47372/g.133255 Transcript_47372/m.133255 type:complete len:222 (-) Transcript_47372:157-822(-)